MEIAERRAKIAKENQNARSIWIDWMEFLLASCGLSDDALDIKRYLVLLTIRELNITSLRVLGFTQQEIAEQMDCHHTTVGRNLKKIRKICTK